MLKEISIWQGFVAAVAMAMMIGAGTASAIPTDSTAQAMSGTQQVNTTPATQTKGTETVAWNCPPFCG